MLYDPKSFNRNTCNSSVVYSSVRSSSVYPGLLHTQRFCHIWRNLANIFIIFILLSFFTLISFQHTEQNHSMQCFAFLYISLYFSEFLCIYLHFSAFLGISLNCFAHLWIVLHFSAFLCISVQVLTFLYISLNFSAIFGISLNFLAFLCILHSII